MSPNSIPLIITAFIMAAIGLFVFFNNKRSAVNSIFTMLCFSMVWWLVFYSIMYSSRSPASALYWARIGFLGIIFIPIFAIHFILRFLNMDYRPAAIYLLYAVSVPAIVLSRTAYIYEDIAVHKWGYYPTAGKYYYLFLLMFAAFLSCGVFLLFKHARARDVSRPRQLQLRYLSLAFGIGVLGSIDYLDKYPFFDVYPFGYICAALFIGIIAYTIVRHQLMDIEVIIKKTLVFAGLFTFVYAVFAGIAYLGQKIFQEISGVDRWIAMIPSVLIVIFSLKPIEKLLVHMTNRFLFQKKYDYKELLKTFTAEVLTVVNLSELVDLTVGKLADIIKLDSCAVLLFDDQKQQFDVVASRNIKDPSTTLVRPDGIVTFLEETHGYILKKELQQKHIFVPASIQEILDKLNSELIIPMVLHDEVIGVLSLGKKKSDEDYDQDDLDILLPLARTLAIAISNAELFDELGKTQAEAAQKEKMAVIGTLSAGINHEICNPLGIARGQCEAFLLNIKDGLYKDKSQDELLDKAKEIMTKVIKETDRATAITKKLSSFAKPAKGESEPISIAREVDEALGLVNYELKLEKIEVEKRIEKDLPNIFADRKQFQEVLFNLIRNAGQAIGEKGRITVSAWSERGKVFIDIQDTGSGVPEDKLKELFNPFFTTKEPGKGTGLGLFIVRQVVEKNGGRIYLKETKVGEGTTFRIEFPAALQEVKV